MRVLLAENDFRRMTGPDCAVMCNLINKYTRTHARGCQALQKFVPPNATRAVLLLVSISQSPTLAAITNSIRKPLLILLLPFQLKRLEPPLPPPFPRERFALVSSRPSENPPVRENKFQNV